jgi:ASC-1-like (ASCH) protein|uniref:hypothetical protein n=1 Tax=Alloprevotella sp. TaxID=1872471 RepID=UPI004029239D
MKKTYLAPSAVSINMIAEGMMAASGRLQSTSEEKIKTEDQILSNQQNWEHPIWGANED